MKWMIEKLIKIVSSMKCIVKIEVLAIKKLIKSILDAGTRIFFKVNVQYYKLLVPFEFNKTFKSAKIVCRR